MSQTPPVPTRPGEPQDPELRERYLRDAESVRAARRAEAARLAAEVPPSRTPRGLIWLLAGLVTLVLVTIVGFALVGPMLKQAETSERPLSPATTGTALSGASGAPGTALLSHRLGRRRTPRGPRTAAGAPARCAAPRARSCAPPPAR